MKRFICLFVALLAAAMLNGCGNKSASADAAPDFKATPGDGQVTLTWTAAPDVDYWLFYATGTSVTTANWLQIGGRAVVSATSPYSITGLTNNTAYSFTMNGRKNGGPGGPGAATQVVTPRFAGTNWSVGTPVGTGRLNGVSALGASNVIVGANGVIFAGAAGAATAQTNPAAPLDLNAVAYGGSGFVAVGAAGAALFTTDAVTWTTKSTGTTADLYALTTPGSGAFVAVGAAGTTVYSADGNTWGTPVVAGNRALYAVSYGVGRYVAVGAAGTIVTSTDGTTWVAATSGTSNDLRGVGYGALLTTTGTGAAAVTSTTNIFVATGVAGTILTSADGLTWTVRTPLSATTMNAVTFGGQFVAVGNAGSIYTSLDGATWTRQTSGTSNDLTALARTTSGYVAVGAQGAYLSSF